MDSDSLLRNSLGAINSVIADFQTNPYTFLYESDLKCALFTALRQRISGNVLIPGTGGNQYVLDLIYSEYLDRIDIACIDPEEIEKLDTSSLKQDKGYDTYIYSLPVFLGIELKYIWMGYKKGINILEQDYLKIAHNSVQIEKIKNWIVLGFIQRNEEADSFLNNVSNHCSLLPLAAVEHLNKIYIVTPDKIIADR